MVLKGAVMKKGDLGKGDAVSWAGSGGTTQDALLMESRLEIPSHPFSQTHSHVSDLRGSGDGF